MAQRLRKRLHKSIGLLPPLIYKGLLTEEEVMAVYRYVIELKDGASAERCEAAPREEEDEEAEGEEEEGPEPGSDAWLAEQMRLTAQLQSANFEEEEEAVATASDEPKAARWVRCSSSHEKLYLHHGGCMHDGKWRSFAEECPLLLVKLLEVMHDSNGGQKLADSSFSKEERAGEERDLSRRPPLHIRCIEFHDYKPGGALMDPGHIDVGSTLTLSVQLSPPGPPEAGGRFLTTDGASGVQTAHELQRGDAILFCSTQVHNVSPLNEGVRNSLVIELWTEGANRVDRER